jgi:hypothetical protein
VLLCASAAAAAAAAAAASTAAFSQWLQFCRANPSGVIMPDDVQVALADILNLAAAWA